MIPIPSGYLEGDDGLLYKYFNEKETWNDAQQKCASDGGNLAQKTVMRLMEYGWIGLSDQWQEGKWETPERKVLTYNQWDIGQPNNDGDADCVTQVKYPHA